MKHTTTNNMVTMDQIQALSKDIATLFHPEQIILFGSYAYGTPIQN